MSLCMSKLYAALLSLLTSIVIIGLPTLFAFGLSFGACYAQGCRETDIATLLPYFTFYVTLILAPQAGWFGYKMMTTERPGISKWNFLVSAVLIIPALFALIMARPLEDRNNKNNRLSELSELGFSVYVNPELGSNSFNKLTDRHQYGHPPIYTSVIPAKSNKRIGLTGGELSPELEKTVKEARCDIFSLKNLLRWGKVNPSQWKSGDEYVVDCYLENNNNFLIVITQNKYVGKVLYTYFVKGNTFMLFSANKYSNESEFYNTIARYTQNLVPVTDEMFYELDYNYRRDL